MCSLSVKLLVGQLRRGVCVCVCVCALCQLSSLWADFVRECVCVCALCQLSSLWADFVGECVCVCVCSLSVKLLVG